MLIADYKETLKACMEDAGMSQDAVAGAIVLCESGACDELIRFLRLQRCALLEEMHDCRRRVDRMDYLIRRSENHGLLKG